MNSRNQKRIRNTETPVALLAHCEVIPLVTGGFTKQGACNAILNVDFFQPEQATEKTTKSSIIWDTWTLILLYTIYWRYFRESITLGDAIP